MKTYIKVVGDRHRILRFSLPSLLSLWNDRLIYCSQSVYICQAAMTISTLLMQIDKTKQKSTSRDTKICEK